MTPFELYKKAKEERYAIGQFNVSTLEAVKAVVNVAEKLKAPVIIGTSQGEAEYLGLENIVALVNAAKEKTGLPLILNLDHSHSVEATKAAIETGYNAVHFDGSGLPLGKNIAQTKDIVDYAHSKNILVEGELGHLGGGSALHQDNFTVSENDMTNPNEAAKFVEATGVDSLGVAFGNFHGVYKNPPQLDFVRLEEISRKLPNVYLVLHGGSGIPDEQVKKAVSFGIVKENVNTELRMAFRNSLFDFLKNNPEEYKPYNIMPAAIGAMEKVIEAKINLLGSAAKL